MRRDDLFSRSLSFPFSGRLDIHQKLIIPGFVCFGLHGVFDMGCFRKALWLGMGCYGGLAFSLPQEGIFRDILGMPPCC
jgi:hypothetical protein